MLALYKNLAKLTRATSKLVGKRGTDLPGKILRKFDDKVLIKLARQYDEIVFVTGTNGKTTTSNLIGHTLREAGTNFINNFEGANMLDGIISTFAIQSKNDTKLAVIEIDEGSIRRVMKYITPTKFVINNFFRDQIDRFGEIDTLIATIGEQLEGKNIQLILNSDDPFVTRLSKYGKDNIYFGIAKDAYDFSDYGISESKFCPNCGTELTYEHIHYSQLGFYECEKCGFKHQQCNYEVTGAKVEPFIKMSVNNEESFNTNLAGDYNIYNLIAAYTLLKQLGLEDEQIKNGLGSYTSKNGRMQSIKISKNTTSLLNLAKNPAGLNASLAIGNSIKDEINYLLVLNDNGADGFDISWIWDTDFNILANQNIKNIICSGKRAKELALRLKYSEVDANVIVLESINHAVSALKKYEEKYAIVIPNYTALAETQKELEN
ncbi:MurT ligase domain-containing protein [Gemella cuniculi]|uniref:MurT ligase domain-containing protein n=1 Tax=Gemella cuniculi TaxID=150240 RepID=UPI000421B9C8|nr:MurT ligase domain-containing protein [Gemella cuniculi]